MYTCIPNTASSSPNIQRVAENQKSNRTDLRGNLHRTYSFCTTAKESICRNQPSKGTRSCVNIFTPVHFLKRAISFKRNGFQAPFYFCSSLLTKERNRFLNRCAFQHKIVDRTIHAFSARQRLWRP